MLRIEYNDTNLTLADKPTNWGSGVYLYNNEYFTGVIYYYYPNTTQISAEYEYKNGVFDGRQAEYWPNGKIKGEYFEKYGAFYDSVKQWNEQGVLISHQEYDNIGNYIRTLI